MQEFVASTSEMHWKCAYVFKLYRFWHSFLLSALFHLLRDTERPNRSHHKQKNTVILWSGCKDPAKFLLPGPNPPLNRGEMWCKVSATPSRLYFFLPVFTVQLLCGSKQGCNPPYYTILSIHHILFFPLWKGRWGNRWKGLAIFASSTKAIVRGDWLHVCNQTHTYTHTCTKCRYQVCFSPAHHCILHYIYPSAAFLCVGKHDWVQLHVLGKSDACKKGECAKQWPDYKSKSVSYVEDGVGGGG